VSNFTFLQQDWPELYETAREAEQNVNSAPRTSCFYARRSLERAVKWLYANDSYLKQPYADNLAAHSDKPISSSDSLHTEGLDGLFGDAGAPRFIHLLQDIELRAAA
jgi:hypothetical protein